MNKYDERQPGLMLRTRPSGHKSYYFVYNHRGRTRWYHIGPVTKTQARKIAIELRYKVSRGEDPQAEKLTQRIVGTFAELYERYLEERAKRKNKSWQQADYLVRKHLLQRWARLDARSITQADVYSALGKIASPSVFNQTLASASAVFRFGVKVKIIPFNPCKDIDRNETRSRERVLSDSEIAAFWPHLTPPLRVILLTGQRGGEVGRMRREHVVDKVWWRMPGPAMPALGWPGTKNGENHRVFLSAPVRELIGDGETGFVFNRTHLDAVMRGICTKLGVADAARPHDLRRTFATRVAALGFGRQALDRVLNHRDRGVVTVYDRYEYAIEDQRVMEAVAAHVLALAEGRPTSGEVVEFAPRATVT
jgi:integrase